PAAVAGRRRPSGLGRGHRDPRALSTRGQGADARGRALTGRAQAAGRRHRLRAEAEAALPRRADQRSQHARESAHHGHHLQGGAPRADLRGHHRTRHGCRVLVLRSDRGDASGHDSRGWHARRDPPRRTRDDDTDRHAGAAAVSRPAAAGNRPAPMLELQNVETYRGAAQILRAISLTLGAGEAVCLVGRNGAGKTTTIDSIMGLLSTRTGSIHFKGRDVTRLPAHERARLGIGYAPEDCGIFPDLTVAENFQLTAWLGKTATKTNGGAAAEQIFSIFPEVKSLLTRRGLHLSGGQKKMVAITRALTLSPAVLLLDEPF